jgi:hypothetical protein
VFPVLQRGSHTYLEAKNWCRFHQPTKPTTSSKERRHTETAQPQMIAVSPSPARTFFPNDFV